MATTSLRQRLAHLGLGVLLLLWLGVGSAWGQIVTPATDLTTIFKGFNTGTNPVFGISGQAQLALTTTNPISASSGTVTVLTPAAPTYTVGQYVVIQGATGCTTNPNGIVSKITAVSTSVPYSFSFSLSAATFSACGGSSAISYLAGFWLDASNDTFLGGPLNLPSGGTIASADTGAPTITFAANSISTNQPLTVSGSSGQIQLTEGGAPACSGSYDWIWADSGAQRLKACNHGGSAVQLVDTSATQTLQNKTLDSTNTNQIYPCAPQFSTTDTLSNSGTTEQIFATKCQIPSSVIVANKVLKIWVGTDIVSTGSPTLTFRLKLCTVSGCGSGTVVNVYVGEALAPASTSTATKSGGAAFIIQGTGVAGSSVAVECSIMAPPATNNAGFAPFARNTVATQVAGVPTNGILYLQASAQWSSTSGGTNSITFTQLIPEWLN